MVTIDRPYRVIGTRPIRHDGADKVTGRAAYGADIRLPGMLWARVKRSPHAHARIKRIDASKALALPGVKAVITRADVPLPPDKLENMGESIVNVKWLLDNILAGDKVLYDGHAVAAVAAVDPHIAEDALDLIAVEYEELPPVLHLRDAMLDTAPLLHADMHTAEFSGEQSARPSNIASHLQFQMGDLERGFAEADVIIEREFETTMVHQGYIEPHTGTAFWQADGNITVWTSTQGPFLVRDLVSKLLDVPVSRVTVAPMEIGGGFGGKIPTYLEPLAAILSHKTGKAVKMTMTREEVLKASGPTSGAYVRIKMGARKDGAITAAQAYLAYEAGAYPGAPVAGGCRCVFSPYHIPNLLIDGYDVVVNKPKVSAYRAPGAPASEFGAECVVNELAERLGLDPLEMRLRNAAQEGTRRADGQLMPRIGGVDVFQAARNSAHYQSELIGPHRGRGVAVAFWHNAGLESSSFASINADGTVDLVLGSVDIGGTRPALAMQLAETLGITAQEVKPRVVDTDTAGFTHVTGGSRTAFAGGWAAYALGLDLRRQLQDRAATIWSVHPDTVTYGDDGVIRGPQGQALTFQALAAQLSSTGGPIVGRASVQPTTQGPALAAHIVDVEVDPETGKVEILRYTAVQDVGTAIHPSYVEGQIQGGAAQGAGMALLEEYVYDADGHLRNASLLDYRMPTALDLPLIETILVEVPNPGHPYGVRGVGEVPIVPPAPALAAAIHDAIGVRMTKLPMSPRAILERTILEQD